MTRASGTRSAAPPPCPRTCHRRRCRPRHVAGHRHRARRVLPLAVATSTRKLIAAHQPRARQATACVRLTFAAGTTRRRPQLVLPHGQRAGLSPTTCNLRTALETPRLDELDHYAENVGYVGRRDRRCKPVPRLHEQPDAPVATSSTRSGRFIGSWSKHPAASASTRSTSSAPARGPTARRTAASAAPPAEPTCSAPAWTDSP